MGRVRHKINWKLIKVPAEIHWTLKDLSQRTKTPIWKIIHQSFTYFRTAYLSHFSENRSELDRKIWYIYKLSSSVGAFRENPTKKNLDMTMRTVGQIEKRLGVNMHELKLALKNYYVRPIKRNKVVLNDTCKMVLIEIISK